MNFFILITSLGLSFLNVFAVRVLYDDPTDIANIRSILVVSALISPLMIFGLDAAIGKISRLDRANLSMLLLLKDLTLCLIVFIGSNFLAQTIFLASVIGLAQFLAAQKLVENKELAFLLISQIFSKIAILLSIFLSWLYFADRFDAVLLASLIIFVGCIVFSNPLKLRKQLKRNFFSSAYRSLSSNTSLIVPNLAALFLLDAMIRIPYLTAAFQNSTIRNEYDVAVAFSSTWILPLLLKSRALEIHAGYEQKKFLALYSKKRWLIFGQTIALVILSVIVIITLGRIGVLRESVSGVLTKLPYCAAPIAFCLIFPNVVRLFFLRNTDSSVAYRNLITHILITVILLLSMVALSSPNLTLAGLFALFVWMNTVLKRDAKNLKSRAFF